MIDELPEILTSLQRQLEIFYQCLNPPYEQNKTILELLEIANFRQVSLNELRKEIFDFKQHLDKLLNLLRYQGNSLLLYFVKSQLLLQEILDLYWYFFLLESQKKIIVTLTVNQSHLYKILKNRITPETSKQDTDYVALEALKHSINSLIETGLRVEAISQQEIASFGLEDITPQESETVLVFLSTMKIWKPVYEKLTGL